MLYFSEMTFNVLLLDMHAACCQVSKRFMLALFNVGVDVVDDTGEKFIHKTERY